MKSLMLTKVSLGIMVLMANMTVAEVVVEVLASKYVEEKYTTTIDCDEALPSDDFLCNGSHGVEGLPYCDKYDEETRARIFPELRGCWDREIFPLTFCKEFGDLEGTYEYCRQVPESEEYIEYLETGGPDESCLFDVEQIKCLPSPITDECPENFGTNEDGQCFPLNEDGDWECPEGYHSTEDDESGQCYPDTEPCYPGHLSNPNTTNCSDEELVCEKFNLTGCMVDGRMVGTFPDEGCLRSLSQDKCAALNFECPDGFVTASISNLTITPCLPLSYEDAEQATRERQINDQNRCPSRYELVDIQDADPGDHGNVGKCIPNNDDDD